MQKQIYFWYFIDNFANQSLLLLKNKFILALLALHKFLYYVKINLFMVFWSFCMTQFIIVRTFVKNPKIIFRKLFLVCENCFIFFFPKLIFALLLHFPVGKWNLTFIQGWR